MTNLNTLVQSLTGFVFVNRAGELEFYETETEFFNCELDDLPFYRKHFVECGNTPLIPTNEYVVDYNGEIFPAAVVSLEDVYPYGVPAELLEWATSVLASDDDV